MIGGMAMRNDSSADYDYDGPVLETHLTTGFLAEPYTGIFFKARPRTIKAILPHCGYRKFVKGEEIFKEGKDADNEALYIVMSGEFHVMHKVEDEAAPVRISTDIQGSLMGDIEMLVHGMPQMDRLYGRANKNRSTIICGSENGVLMRIFPPNTIFNTRDFQIAKNVATLLSIKLLARTAEHGNAFVRLKELRIVHKLRDIACQLLKKEFGEIPSPIPDIELILPITRHEMAMEPGIHMDVVSKLYNNKLRGVDCEWPKNNGVMTVKGDFLRSLVTDPDSLVKPR
jgi:CRP-like cAMP-binding protein